MGARDQKGYFKSEISMLEMHDDRLNKTIRSSEKLGVSTGNVRFTDGGNCNFLRLPRGLVAH